MTKTNLVALYSQTPFFSTSSSMAALPLLLFPNKTIISPRLFALSQWRFPMYGYPRTPEEAQQHIEHAARELLPGLQPLIVFVLEEFVRCAYHTVEAKADTATLYHPDRPVYARLPIPGIGIRWQPNHVPLIQAGLASFNHLVILLGEPDTERIRQFAEALAYEMTRLTKQTSVIYWGNDTQRYDRWDRSFRKNTPLHKARIKPGPMFYDLYRQFTSSE